MYQALGRAVKRNADGSITARVEFIDERTNKTVRFEDITAATVPLIKQACRDGVRDLVDREKDATLNAAIVNVMLAQV